MWGNHEGGTGGTGGTEVCVQAAGQGGPFDSIQSSDWGLVVHTDTEVLVVGFGGHQQ